MIPYKIAKFFSFWYPTDKLAPKFPVSVKGVVQLDNRVVLLKNIRNEWELPGGKLDPGESPETCVVREIEEELSLSVSIVRILDSWLYDIQGKVEVLIVTYECTPTSGNQELHISHEHKEIGLFPVAEIANLSMPAGYKKSIQTVFTG